MLTFAKIFHPSMHLVVDIGNTKIKAGLFNGSEWIHGFHAHPKLFVDQLQQEINGYDINQVLSSATGSSKEIVTSLQKLGLIVQVLDCNTPVPFINKYDTPETLGVDRVALIAAAVHKYPNRNVLVIDAGTCITYDFKTNKEEYLGGAISPGLNMRYRALHNQTAKLPLITFGDAIEKIGKSTSGSIHSGVVNGVCYEIEGTIAWYEKQFGTVLTVITGGDGEFLSKTLKNGIFANPNFLLEGLNQIILFNKNQ